MVLWKTPGWARISKTRVGGGEVFFGSKKCTSRNKNTSFFIASANADLYFLAISWATRKFYGKAKLEISIEK